PDAQDGRLAAAARPSARGRRHRDPAGALMAAILARKLGMTQIFGEDGAIARVTVLAAGPCHVTAVRTAERDGYDAVQLAFGATKEKALAKADAPPMRHLVEFRDEGGGLSVGETVDVGVFEAGQRVKISGISKGKGFQ